MTTVETLSLLVGVAPLAAAAAKWFARGQFSRAATKSEEADLCRRLGLSRQADAADAEARMRVLRHEIMRERRIWTALALSRADAIAAVLFGVAIGLTSFTTQPDVDGRWAWAVATAQVILGVCAYALVARESRTVEQEATKEAKAAADRMSSRAAQQPARAKRDGRLVRALREWTRE